MNELGLSFKLLPDKGLIEIAKSKERWEKVKVQHTAAFFHKCRCAKAKQAPNYLEKKKATLLQKLERS